MQGFEFSASVSPFVLSGEVGFYRHKMVPIHFIIMSVQLLNLAQKMVSSRGLWFININTVSLSINEKAYDMNLKPHQSFLHILHPSLQATWILRLEQILPAPQSTLSLRVQGRTIPSLMKVIASCSILLWFLRRSGVPSATGPSYTVKGKRLLRSETSWTAINCKPAE